MDRLLETGILRISDFSSFPADNPPSWAPWTTRAGFRIDEAVKSPVRVFSLIEIGPRVALDIRTDCPYILAPGFYEPEGAALLEQLVWRLLMIAFRTETCEIQVIKYRHGY